MRPEDAIAALAPAYVPAIYKRIVAALAEARLTKTQLAHKCHADPASISHAVRILRDHKLVRIAEWERAVKGPMIPRLELGDSPDAAKPPRLTSAEKSQRWRNRGGDAHRAEKIKSEAASLPKRMTLAGLLGL